MQPVPIGRPCAAHEFALVDADGGLVRDGEAGELLVAGPSLMQGYCNRPDLTEAAFAALPGRPQVQAYRTGDRVRCDAQGQYHFLGRLDDMIKTRGYRVEPAEIEAVLLRHPQVEEAAIIPLPDEQLGNRLLALVVLTGDAASAPLASHCGAYLPGYMIPVQFIPQTGLLPRTQTGKIDRAACRRMLEVAGGR
jgi:acyl-coenzyme A synthetase/AMP-(fatty) acid ligase